MPKSPVNIHIKEVSNPKSPWLNRQGPAHRKCKMLFLREVQRLATKLVSLCKLYKLHTHTVGQ